jgi:transposase
MARRTFDVIDVTEVLMHWHAGRSLSGMSQSLGVDRKTIRKYVAPAVAAGIVPGGPAKSEAEWQGLVREWFPELADMRLRQVTWPAIAEHHDYIVEQLKAGVRMSTIHQRLAGERGLAASVASLRRYVAANVAEEARRAQVVVWSPRQAEAGEQAQIDYGMLGRWLDPACGKLRTVWAFVMVLACSRHMFVRPVLKMDQRAWTECHVEAFAFFGGYACVDHATAVSKRQKWWRSPPWSADGVDSVPGQVSRSRGSGPGQARRPSGGRVSGVCGRPVQAEHGAGHCLRLEGVLLGRR